MYISLQYIYKQRMRAITYKIISPLEKNKPWIQIKRKKENRMTILQQKEALISSWLISL